MAKFSFEPRVTRKGGHVPACTFFPYLVVLANAVADMTKSPANAPRTIEMAVQYIQEQLPRRRREEVERSNPITPAEKWTRLRMQFTKRDLRALEQVAWSLAGEAPPLGPAMRDAISAIRMILEELNAAMLRALPLGNEDAEGTKPEALPDIDLPETAASRGVPTNVDYAALIDK